MTNTTEQNVTIKKRIIKIHQCPTLSNNSTLTYHKNQGVSQLDFKGCRIKGVRLAEFQGVSVVGVMP